MTQIAPKQESYQQTLPGPVTAKADSNVAWKVGVTQSSAPAFVALSVGLAAVFHNQPKVILLFVGASIVVIGLYFIALPTHDGQSHPIVVAFLQRLPDVFTVLGGILIMLGIGFAFPYEVALIPLFAFVFFAVFPALTGMMYIGPRITAVSYVIALGSLVAFVVLACKS